MTPFIPNVTVSVPVPSPLKTLNPATDPSAGVVTPNAGGRSIVELASKYRPCNVARVHPGCPFDPCDGFCLADAAGVPERLSPAIVKRPAAIATGIIRRRNRGPALT